MTNDGTTAEDTDFLGSSGRTAPCLVPYLAAVNAGKEIVKLKLDLDMFAGKTVSLYKDDKKGEPQLVTLKVKESGKVQLEILPQGGVVLVNN